MTFTIPAGEITFRATRSRGPGGQHVNKAATRAEVRWNVIASPSLTNDQRRRVLARLGNRIDARGVLRVAADTHRSQARNRAAAESRLRELVRQAVTPPKPRKRTKPPKAAKEQRLKEKRRRARTKERRGPVHPDE